MSAGCIPVSAEQRNTNRAHSIRAGHRSQDRLRPKRENLIVFYLFKVPFIGLSYRRIFSCVFIAVFPPPVAVRRLSI